MKWKVAYKKDALKSIDVSLRIKAVDYVEEHIASMDDPRLFGHALKGKFRGLWRYQWRKDYRIICEIKDKEITILVVEIGHRSDIYKG